MNEFEAAHYYPLLDVKRAFNQWIQLPGNMRGVADLVCKCERMILGYRNKKASWSEMQRAACIVRIVNFLVIAYPDIIHDFSQTGDLFNTLMFKLEELFHDENLDQMFLDYLSIKFQKAYLAYEQWYENVYNEDENEDIEIEVDDECRAR